MYRYFKSHHRAVAQPLTVMGSTPYQANKQFSISCSSSKTFIMQLQRSSEERERKRC